MGPGRFGWACLIVVGGFVFDGWLHADFAVQALVVEPVDVRQGGPFDVVGVLPGSFVIAEISLVEPVEALGGSRGPMVSSGWRGAVYQPALGLGVVSVVC